LHSYSAIAQQRQNLLQSSNLSPYFVNDSLYAQRVLHVAVATEKNSTRIGDAHHYAPLQNALDFRR
jgi:hypothetical protein